LTDAGNGELDVFACDVDMGAMTSSPVYCNHSRGRNWLARVATDPTAPGGLARIFQKAARGNGHYYLVDGLGVGDAVEFGADYYSCRGFPDRRRWYGVVISISDTGLTIQHCTTAAAAIRRSTELRDESNVLARRQLLLAEMAQLARRMDEIQRELDAQVAPPGIADKLSPS
jgi:hypothetical protein